MNYQRLTYFQNISHLNLCGIARIGDGDGIGAIQYFHEALKLLQNGICEELSDENRFLSGKEFMASNSVIINQHDPDEEHNRVLSTIPIEGSNMAANEVFALFDRGLHIKSDPEDLLGLEFELIALLFSAVLLFNSGLANHIKGLQDCNSHMLSRALQIYCVAYDSLAGLLQVHPENASLITLGFLATANNIGHLHSYFCQFSSAKIFCNEFLAQLSIRGSDKDTNSVTEEENAVFKANLCFFDKLDNLSAPAA